MKRILFSGLGRMGLPMAKNLSKSNKEIYAYDINPNQIQRLEEFGIKHVKDLDSKIDVFISMVPDVKAL